MGYFGNGTEGEMYETKWCSRCVHQTNCAVWTAHMLYNYDQCKEPKIEALLNCLIPKSKDGLSNNRCRMFKAIKTGSDPDDGEPMLFEKHEIGGKPIEIKDVA